MFISILYMFRTAMCPSSRELIVWVRQVVYVTLCRWPSGMHLHTRRSSSRQVVCLQGLHRDTRSTKYKIPLYS